MAADLIRGAVGRNEMPWNGFATEDPLRNQVLRLVKSCCQVKQSARPSAPEVVDQLRAMLNFSWLQKNMFRLQSNQEIKDRVSAILEDADTETQLTDADVRALHSWGEQGDATAAYLLGLAIWQERARPEEDSDQLLLLSDKHAAQGK